MKRSRARRIGALIVLGLLAALMVPQFLPAAGSDAPALAVEMRIEGGPAGRPPLRPVDLPGAQSGGLDPQLPGFLQGRGIDKGAYLRARLDAGLRNIAFFIVPSAMAFLAFGDVLAAALYQSGQFTHESALHVWAILGGSAVGLLASTLGRLYASTYYALRDTRTPLRFAVVRVVLTTVLGYLCSIPLPPALGSRTRLPRIRWQLDSLALQKIGRDLDLAPAKRARSSHIARARVSIRRRWVPSTITIVSNPSGTISETSSRDDCHADPRPKTSPRKR